MVHPDIRNLADRMAGTRRLKLHSKTEFDTKHR